MEENVIGLLLMMVTSKSIYEEMEDSEIDTAFELILSISQSANYASEFENGPFQALLLYANENPENAKFQKNFYLLFSNLSPLDQNSYLFSYIDMPVNVILHGTNDDLIYSSLISIGNLSRSDQRCISIIENNENLAQKFISLVDHPKDNRIVQSVLGVLRNICIPAVNKDIFFNLGLMEVLVKKMNIRERPSIVIQYEVVGAVKSLVIGGEKHTKGFLDLGGLEILSDLANGKIAPQDDEEDEKEKKKPELRVQYEATRVLIRISEQGDRRKLVADAGGIGPIVELVKSSFEILQAEALKALHKFSDIDELRPYLIQNKTVEVLKEYNSSNVPLKEKAELILKNLI